MTLISLHAESATSTDAKVEWQKMTVAAGCFWSVELIYQRQGGVGKTAVGYIGGKTKNPDYESVCTGTTGHAEAVQLEFNPKETSCVLLSLLVGCSS